MFYNALQQSDIALMMGYLLILAFARRVLELARRRALRVARSAREVRLDPSMAAIAAELATRSTKTTTTVYSKVTFWTRLRRHKLAVAGIVVLTLIVLCAIFAKLLAPFDPNCDRQRALARHAAAAVLPRRTCYAAAHPLGTDEVGRDLLSRLLFGARISLQVGIFTVLLEVIIGTIARRVRRLLRRLGRLGDDAHHRRVSLDSAAAALAGADGDRRRELERKRR